MTFKGFIRKVARGMKQKLLAIIVASLVLMFVAALVTTSIVSNNIASDVLSDTMPELANSTAQAIKGEIQNTISFIQIATEDSTINNTSLEFEDKLGRLQSISAGKSFDKFLSYGVVNSNGKGGTRSGATYDMTTRAFWADVKENKTTVSEPLFGKTSQKWSYIMAVPYQEGGKFAGACYGSIDLAVLSDALAPAKINSTAQVWVIDGNGKIMISENATDIENEANLWDTLKSQASANEIKKIQKAVENGEKYLDLNMNGVNKAIGICDLTIGDTQWKMVLFLNKDDFTSTLGSQIFFAGIIIAIMAIVIIILSAMLITKTIKPFISITNKIENHKEEIMGASDVINTSSGSLANSSKDQAASIEQISASIEETNSMIEQSAQGAENSKNLTEQAKEIAAVGNQKMVDMSETIGEIKKSSDEIGKIINVIDDIASQTNILALNAAVEAARAGDAGKGFAVVAEEVRNLAQKSADAAKSTQAIIERNLKFAEQGVHVSNDVAQAIGAIQEAIDKISVIAIETANAANEESLGIAQVSQAVKTVERASQSTADTAESSTQASRSLAEKAVQLDEIVKELKALING